MGGRKSKLTGNRPITIALYGVDNAGKTTVAKVLNKELDLSVVATIGFAQYEITHTNEKIKLYDLGGRINFREAWWHYYADLYGFIYVIDSSEQGRLDESREVLKQLLQEEKIKNKPILILANKQDREEALDKNAIVKNLELEQFVNDNPALCRVELCTAKLVSPSGANSQMDPAIQNGFDWLVKTIYENYTVLHKRVQEDVQKRNEVEQAAKRERQKAVQKIREEREKQEGKENDEDDNPTTNGFVPIGQAIKNAEIKSSVATNANSEM